MRLEPTPSATGVDSGTACSQVDRQKLFGDSACAWAVLHVAVRYIACAVEANLLTDLLRRVLCARQLIKELRAAQAAAAATPAADAVLPGAGGPDVPVPPQAAQQHGQLQRPAGPARPAPEQSRPPQPGAAGAAGVARPQVPAAPANVPQGAERSSPQIEHVPGAPTLAQPDVKHKSGCEAAAALAGADVAAAAHGDPPRAAERQAAGMAEAAPSTAKAPGSPCVSDVAAQDAAAAAAAAASTRQSAGPRTTGNHSSAGQAHNPNQQAAAAARAPPRSRAQPPAGPWDAESRAQHACHASPAASQQQQLPPLADTVVAFTWDRKPASCGWQRGANGGSWLPATCATSAQQPTAAAPQRFAHDPAMRPGAAAAAAAAAAEAAGCAAEPPAAGAAAAAGGYGVPKVWRAAAGGPQQEGVQGCPPAAAHLRPLQAAGPLGVRVQGARKAAQWGKD